MNEVLTMSVYAKYFLGDKWEWIYFVKFRELLLAISK